MSSLKDTVEKIRNLEAEKRALSAEVEELKKMADAKANALIDEISALRDEISSLKVLMSAEKQTAPSSVDFSREPDVNSQGEFVEKTLGASDKLGSQIFPISPFSQHYDGWLVSLRQLVSEFESNSVIKVDEQFVKDRSQIFLDVEGALAQKRLEEKNIGVVSKSLVEANHLVVQNDKEYSDKSRELSFKRDSKVGGLTNRVRELMREAQNLEDPKTNKIFKKKNEIQLVQVKRDLQAAETELETAQRNFNAEQDKLREGYEKKKQELAGQVDSLRKELERLESDTSLEVRQAATKALDSAINALVQRTTSQVA